MSYMMLKVMHPTTRSMLEIEAPDNITLNDVVSELKENGFVTDVGTIGAVLRNGEQVFDMDMSKTLEENGVRNNSTIQLFNRYCYGIYL